MKTNHTPGPWRVMDGHDYKHVKSTEGEYICRVSFRDNSAENAKLIAAAPELLEALEKMTERYTSLVNCGDCGNWDPETEDEVKQARKAIAAATP